MILKIQGIVLGQTPLGAQDKGLTLLTSEMGLLEAYAKNTRRKKSQAASAVEVLSYSEFCLFQGKTRYIVDSADLIANFSGLRGDLGKLSLAAYFAELTRYVLPSEDNGGECLRLLLNTLHLLEKGKRSCDFLKAVYELRLLSLCGFAPDVGSCCACGETEADFFFLPGEGQVCCKNCIGGISADLYRMQMPVGVRMAFAHVAQSPERSIYSFKLSPEGEKAFRALSEAFMIFHTGAQFKSLEFYKSMEGLSS